MYEMVKRVLKSCLSVIAYLCVIGCCMLYFATSGMVATGIINDLRLDSYVTWDTGLGCVVLVWLLVWCPLWLAQFAKRNR